MKTILKVPYSLMTRLKREVVRQQRTISELVEAALRGLFQSSKKPARAAPLPSFHGGSELVDIANRDALYQAVEGK